MSDATDARAGFLPKADSWGQLNAHASEISPEYRYAFISTGYRVHLRPKQALLSVFRLHNESLNVWTHCAGVVLFVTLFVYTCTMKPSGEAHSLAEGLSTRLAVLKAHADKQWLANGATLESAGGRLALLASANASVIEFATWPRDLLVGATLESVVDARQRLVHEVGEALRIVSERLPSARDGLGELASRLRASVAALTAEIELPPTLAEVLGTSSMLTPAPAVGASSTPVARPRDADGGHDGGGDRCERSDRASRLDALVGEALRVLEARLPELRGRTVERWPLYVFVASALVCLSASVVYHLFGTANERWSATFCSLDFTGIVCLIVGSTVPCVHYGFYDSRLHQAIYLSSIGTMGGLLLTCTLLPFFSQERWRLTRIVLFVLLGAFGAVPLLHLLFYHNFSTMMTNLWAKVAVVCALYLLGTACYATRFPESLWPRLITAPAFLGASHQLWHLFVVAAAYVHFRAVVELWEHVGSEAALGGGVA